MIKKLGIRTETVESPAFGVKVVSLLEADVALCVCQCFEASHFF
jgi:hypothetical protein